MIGEAIRKPGEKGSGGGAEAFRPGVRYVCSKAARVEMRNIAGQSWDTAADAMLLAAELNARVAKPYYHLVLSWHPLEQPSDEQMFAAADHMIRGLGLEEHQIVIGTHHDTPRKHIHLLCNTVHPVTGKVWSKSNDHLRIEQACREIELAQGWSHDRGRFDFEAKPDGTVALTPNPDFWEKKHEGRKSGTRPQSSGARKFQKSTGIETFEQTIPAELRARFAEAVAAAPDWQSLHTALGEMGLRFYKAGSGARVGLLGSDDFVKASAFGSRFSISKMETRLGAYEAPARAYRNDLKRDHAAQESLTGTVWEGDAKAVAAASFKLTLLRRLYCDLHLDPRVSQAIRFVDLQDSPPQITFQDGTTVADHGPRLSTSKSTAESRATMLAMAKAKGWSTVCPSGSAGFVRQMAIEAAQAGLSVQGVPADLQMHCDAILERVERAQRRIEAEARAARTGALEALTARDEALAVSARERAETATQAAERTAEAQAVIAALGSGRDPVRTALRRVARDEEKRIKDGLPDRRAVADPQPAPDTDRRDRGGVQRIAAQLRDNDARELDDMRAVPIDLIAAAGGWTHDLKHPDRHNDPQGRDRRTYTKGPDTIKASRKGEVWLWTSNKTGKSGSVVDLWLADNPGKSLGAARQAFRDLMGRAPVAASRRERVDTAPDHTEARRRWEEAPYIAAQRTYVEERGISKSTVQRFRDQVRQGAFGGIYFAHRHPETGDILGFEQRWQKDGTANKARFAKGGVKTACVLGDPGTASRMVVLEGGLDALALAEIEGRADTLYVSTGGGFGPKTEAAILSLAEGRQVLSGFDNDTAGKSLDTRLRGLLPGAGRLSPPQRVEGCETPCKDWLDVLNAWKAIPAAGPEGRAPAGNVPNGDPEERFATWSGFPAPSPHPQDDRGPDYGL